MHREEEGVRLKLGLNEAEGGGKWGAEARELTVVNRDPIPGKGKGP